MPLRDGLRRTRSPRWRWLLPGVALLVACSLGAGFALAPAKPSYICLPSLGLGPHSQPSDRCPTGTLPPGGPTTVTAPATTRVTALPGAALPGPTTLARACVRRTVVVTLQPGSTLSALCLVVRAQLVVRLARKGPGGPRWAGPPFLEGKGPLVEVFTGKTDGRYTARFRAAKPGSAEVAAGSNAACRFSGRTPCSLPVFVSAVDVTVVATAPATPA